MNRPWESRRERQAQGRRRLALVVFAAGLLVLVGGFAAARGIGAPGVPSGDVALVEDVPGNAGHISGEQFDRAMRQAANQADLKRVPGPGDARYAAIREEALGELLEAAWLQGQAAEMGIEATPAQIGTELERTKAQNFKTEAAFESFLEKSGLTAADVERRVRLQILTPRIQQRVIGSASRPGKAEIEAYYEAAKATQFTQPRSSDTSAAGGANSAQVRPLGEVESQIRTQLIQRARQEAFAEFAADYESRWTARTRCADGFQIERCANYVGEGHPANAPSACYEADPPSGRPADCPAPVLATSPALPGSVSALSPQGQRLPQRPRPEGLRP